MMTEARRMKEEQRKPMCEGSWVIVKIVGVLCVVQSKLLQFFILLIFFVLPVRLWEVNCNFYGVTA